MAGTIKSLGPVALTTTYTTNIMQGGGFTLASGSALLFDVVRTIHVANKAANDTFRLFLGATGANAAGTELFFDYPVSAKLSYDWYTAKKLVSTDFLVGGAATTLTLVMTLMGETYAV
jgi:hypothetical protein